MPDVVIREITAADWPALKDVRLRSLTDSPDAYGRTFDEESRYTDEHWLERASSATGDGDAVTFLAFVDEIAVGIAGSRIEQSERSRAGIYAMWVAPDVRRLGIGASLLERACDWSAKRGVSDLELAITEGNDAAKRLYERAGFVDTGRRELLRPGSHLEIVSMRRAT